MNNSWNIALWTENAPAPPQSVVGGGELIIVIYAKLYGHLNIKFKFFI